MEEAEEDAESDLGKEGEEEAEEESAESDLGKEGHCSFLFSYFINIELFPLFVELDVEGIIIPDENVSQEMGDFVGGDRGYERQGPRGKSARIHLYF